MYFTSDARSTTHSKSGSSIRACVTRLIACTNTARYQRKRQQNRRCDTTIRLAVRHFKGRSSPKRIAACITVLMNTCMHACLLTFSELSWRIHQLKCDKRTIKQKVEVIFIERCRNKLWCSGSDGPSGMRVTGGGNKQAARGTFLS